jgi:hypothetical protein
VTDNMHDEQEIIFATRARVSSNDIERLAVGRQSKSFLRPFDPSGDTAMVL